MRKLVIIKKRNPVAPRLIHAAVSCGNNARDCLDHFPKNHGGSDNESVDNFGCIVRGIVIDNDNFIVQQILRIERDQAFERLAERLGSISSANDD
jgi:hypothetical protein